MRYNKRHLEKLLAKVLPKTENVNGMFYHIGRQQYRDQALSGIGTKKYKPGRWMQLGVCYTLYTSKTEITALKKVISNRKGALSLYTAFELRVTCQKVLNLTNPEILKILNLNKGKLCKPFNRHNVKNETITQFIGRITFESGINALLVPSAADRQGENLVLFSGASLSKSSKITVIDKEDFIV